MTYETILVERADAVTTVTLNRPSAMNALNKQMHFELEDAFDAFDRDASQLICVVTGAGEKAFCAGSDLKASANGELGEYPPHGYAGLVERYELTKPLIAAVNGVCLGGGFEIALACDIIIAAETARFAFPEPRVGAIALAGGIHRLIRQIGHKQAMAYLLTCDRFDAERARELGLVYEVVPLEGLADAVSQCCQRILLSAPLALRATKEVALRGLAFPDVADAIRQQSQTPGYARWEQSVDFKEGARAFAERRPPVWQGR